MTILLNETEIDVNKRNTLHGDSALLWASFKGHVEVLSELIDTQKIDINDANSDGESSLYKASQNGHLGVVMELLENKAIDVNMATTDRITPLMVSSAKGYYEFVKKYMFTQKLRQILQHLKEKLPSFMQYLNTPIA